MPENSVLFHDKDVALGQSRCSSLPQELSEEETESSFTLAFPLSGSYVVESQGHITVASPGKTLLFNQGQTHHIRHPNGGHDASAFVTMETSVAEPFLNSRGSFRVPACPTTPAIDAAIRLTLAKANDGRLSSLQLEEFTIEVLSSTNGAHPVRLESTPSRRELVADAEEYLAVHFRENCTLVGIARQIGASTHHLSRVFKQTTGESLSRRRSRLRLNYALDRILEGADDLSTVAIDAGFYDHAHMTNSFRTHFRLSPTDARSQAGIENRRLLS